MTEKIGLWHDHWHRYFGRYADKSFGPLVGVTGAIGILDKPGVAWWRGTTVAWTIADDIEFFRDMIEKGGARSAVDWAGRLPTHVAEKAADTGSLVHILAESILREKKIDIDPDLVPYADAFRDFLDTTGPNVISTERQVANLAHGYGGTLDLILDYGDGYELWDIKTWGCGDPKRLTQNERILKIPQSGSDKYAETALQLAAYKNAEFIGAPGDPKRHRMPKITRCGVLHLRPDLYAKGWQLYPYDVTEAEWQAFQHCLGAYAWKHSRSKLVVGEPPIVVPKEEAA